MYASTTPDTRKPEPPTSASTSTLPAKDSSHRTATMEEMQKVYDVNAFGPLQVTQAFLPLMRKHGLGGRIVLVGSVASWATAPHAAVYCSSKRAAEGIFEGLRQELAHEGIHVAIVRPGGVSTAIGGKVDADPVKGQSFAKFAELLMKHVGIPPRNITRPISHALTAQFPLATSLGGFDGRFIWLARTILPDRVFDLAMIRIMLGHW
ncbi:hypothetical protein BCR44DRAFT_1512681 [Catenaria anguillulae PL171]|uniref:NAD(P)-binding protein n=1 Tax=Catenaria anguillulae PL171 TaxID=765915 RepID=A0A1Y2HQF3_9FUNG|nr:hypothetical protein BCR44DRAFT_1512681 [Catenaria anguillulae PL171]